MSEPKGGYPADIVTEEGRARLHRGHNLPLRVAQADWNETHGPLHDSEALHVEEVHLAYAPRVKWCERMDGFGCDSNGEWHGHWLAVWPGKYTAFTRVSLERAR